MRAKATPEALKKAIFEGLDMLALAEMFGYASKDGAYQAVWRNNLIELYKEVQKGVIARREIKIEEPMETPPDKETTGELLFAWSRETGTTIDKVHTVLGEFEPYLPMKLEGIK